MKRLAVAVALAMTLFSALPVQADTIVASGTAGPLAWQLDCQYIHGVNIAPDWFYLFFTGPVGTPFTFTLDTTPFPFAIAATGQLNVGTRVTWTDDGWVYVVAGGVTTWISVAACANLPRPFPHR